LYDEHIRKAQEKIVPYFGYNDVILYLLTNKTTRSWKSTRINTK